MFISFHSIGDVDFSAVDGQLIFLPGSENLPLSFRVSIFDDGDLEGVEVFLARLTTNQPRVIVSPDEYTINIQDDDGKSITFLFHSFILFIKK